MFTSIILIIKKINNKMKKQILKEILDINKSLKNELKVKSEHHNEINNLEKEIMIIEEKIEEDFKDKAEYNKFPKVSTLQKLYESLIKTTKEKTFIQYNLLNFQKENERKESKLQAKLKDLLDKINSNNEIIERKIEELEEYYKQIIKSFGDGKVQEQYIISPEKVSVNNCSNLATEIDFMRNIKMETKNIKTKNDQIFKDIESELKKFYELSNVAELSTAPGKNSSHFEKKNYIFQLNDNQNNPINNDNLDSSSSLSMELETNLYYDKLPSEDESLRFIDKVYDIRSNIKPIKLQLKEDFYPPCATIKKEETKKVEPIKVGKPIDYKIKEDKIENEINQIKNEAENIKKKIEEIREKKQKLEEENLKKENNIKHALTKIEIINDQINFIKKQIDDFKVNKENGEYFNTFSINNIINNRNYYLYNINSENNKISDLETYRK